VHETDLTDSTSKSGKPNGLRLLAEADLLLNQGLRRIAGAGQDLPDACNPIEEALALSETQTMSTLEALDTAQAAIRRIQKTQQGFIDEDIGTIKTAMATILNSQQGQDLAGQRLKKALRLLQAVNERISLALVSLQENLGIPNRDILPNEQTEDTGSLHEDTIVGRTDATALEEAIRGQHIEQDDVDALLAELGI
jgi:chemotaxis protein CheZ